MIRRILGALLFTVWAVAFPTTVSAQTRFSTLAVCVDSGSEPLAAWQLELDVSSGEAELVGIEGGAGAFRAAPHYDERALRGGRILLAAFTTSSAVVAGPQAVARVHVRQSTERVQYRTRGIAFGSSTGGRIAAEVWTSNGDCKERGRP